MKLTIGNVAKESGVNVETIRYYERQGLLPEPPRTESGYRLFSRAAIRQVRFIKRAQQLGFSLKETKEILALRGQKQFLCRYPGSGRGKDRRCQKQDPRSQTA
jgi:DNA-binding transcriptional MerR regulator